MSPRILIHPGYPKSGSTSLQSNVFAKHSGVNYLSCHSAGPDAFRDSDRTRAFYALIRDHVGGCDTRVKALWKDHFVPVLDPNQLNVISDETFLSNEGDVEAIAVLLGDVVGAAHVLIVLRDQVDVLRSMYDMYPWLKGDSSRRFLPFAKWVDETLQRAENNIAGSLRFADTIASYHSVFGAENVTVISFDRLFRDPTGQESLCQRLGLASGRFRELLAAPRANTSEDHASKKVVRRVLGPVKGSSFLTASQIALVRKVLGIIVPQKATSVPEQQRKQILEFYRGQRIADLRGRPGEGYIL